ncbi:phage/plasmid primase, P4 family protein [Halorubrum aidingense JCM 13560]|uniref:Phage/plasmid primase, P4 family protein n=1 Tax=Halorubrum aidingense JCM 13560 TaxID=1230454 RepID=M0PGL8_9EURY|nr:DUF5906 domain-containing protein [Halorubrum aidingense]EMA69018.1 phage/plasmid primase, P4 family protein [Halorubrum aidingense JCM 13560]
MEGDDADDPVNDDADDDEIESAVDMDTLRDGIDEGREEVVNDDGDVVARERGLDALTGHSEGTFECVVCGATIDSEHGAKIHFGRKHPDGGDDAVVTPDDDGDEVDWNGLDIDTSNSDDETAGDSDGDWDAVRDTYAAASVGSSPATKADARDVAVKALEDETDWMSIIERCNETTYDLWHLTDDGWEDDGYKHCETRLRAELGSVATDTEVRHIVAQLATKNYVEQERTNARHLDDTLIPVLNGVINVDDIEYDADTRTIDWDTVEVQDMEPNRHRFLYRVQTEWDPGSADVEGLDEWLTTITRTDEARRIIWEFGGHALHPRYPADAFMVALGDGGSGKSQVLEVIKSVLGGDNVSVKTMHAIQTERFAGKDVVDSRANINTELTGKKLQSINKLKTYTAGEEDSVEGKGTAAFKSKNDATMLFASDDPPAMPQDNRALGRRLYPIEFPCAYVQNPDPENPFELQYRSKLEVQAELQADARLKAAFMRAVEGLKRLIEEGDFTSEKSWQERVAQYESYADPIKDMARNCLKPADGSAIESGDLERTANAFFDAKGHEGRDMQQIMSVVGQIPSLPASKRRTRSFTPDDERHTVYDGIAFTGDAKEHWVPSSAHWEHYGGDPNADADDGDEFDGKTLKEIRAEGAGRYDATKVTVASVEDEPAPWLYDQGVVVGEDESLRYEVQSGISLDEGETYVLRDVIVAEDESDVKLQLIDGMTDVFSIEDRDEEQDAAVEDPERGDTPEYSDGDDDECGAEALDNAIVQAAQRHDSVPAIAGRVAGKVDADSLETIKSRVEKLARRGDIPLAGMTHIDDDGNDGDERPQHVKVSIVMNIIESRANSGSVAVSDIVNAAGDHDISESFVEHYIGKWEKSGDVYESGDGGLKVSGSVISANPIKLTGGE